MVFREGILLHHPCRTVSSLGKDAVGGCSIVMVTQNMKESMAPAWLADHLALA